MKSPMKISFDNDEDTIIQLHACGWAYTNPGCKIQKLASRTGLVRPCDFFAPKGSQELPWFDVTDGLVSIRALQIELQNSPDYVCDTDCSIKDLIEMEHVLANAPSSRFRFAILKTEEQLGVVKG